MPFHYREGNILSSDAQVLVNPVNCVGVMGKGLALQFKERYPEMFAHYQSLCRSRRLQIGLPVLYWLSDPSILLFPTKHHWRERSEYLSIEKGLAALEPFFKETSVRSIAFPKLGTGEGGLCWPIVKPLMEKYLARLVWTEVFIYE